MSKKTDNEDIEDMYCDPVYNRWVRKAFSYSEVATLLTKLPIGGSQIFLCFGV